MLLKVDVKISDVPISFFAMPIPIPNIVTDADAKANSKFCVDADTSFLNEFLMLNY